MPKVSTMSNAHVLDARQSLPPLIDPSTHTLFLDVDGTLLDIAATPGAVVVPLALVSLLEQARMRFGGALAIVTGRRISNADFLLKPLKLAASGVHGSEMRYAPDGEIICASTAMHDDIKAQLFSLAEQIPGVLIEPKGAGVALHYRLVPDRRADLEEAVRQVIRDHGKSLVVAAGRMVLEIIPSGNSKGTAIDRLLQVPPFAGRVPVMIGDDVGDKPAFEAVLARGGLALKVAGENFSQRVSDFSGPAAVLDWLRRVVQFQSDVHAPRHCL